MKKLVCYAIVLSVLNTSAIFASDNNCNVIGYHQPDTHVYMGPTWCTNQSFSAITVYGPLYSDSSNISGLSTVAGPIKMTHSTLDTIDIQNTHTAQEVILQKNSKVKGNITFEGPSGDVSIDDSSQLIGKIINGKIVNQVK